MATKLFVGGLSWGTTDESLRNAFSQFGTVVSANVIINKFNGKSKGFGFVEMSSDEEAQKAVAGLNGKDLDGRPVVVNEARPMEPRENRPQGGRGGFRSDSGHGGRRDDRGGRNW